MRSIVLKSTAVVSVSLLVVSLVPATSSAQDSPAVTIGVWAILAMIAGSLLLVGSAAASVDAADCVPGQSLEGILPPGAVQIPDLPAQVKAMIPACAEKQPPPQPEVAPAPGPETANGRG